MNVVLLSGRVVARTSARRELLQALLEWAKAARREAGVQTANVYEDIETPATFGLTGAWDSDDALDAHFRSGQFGILLGALDVLAQSTRLTVTRAKDEEGTDALPAIRRLREGAAARDR
jgi:quinol monooxygenase YgiN